MDWDWRHIKSDVLPSSFYDDRYIKTKIRTHDDKAYTNFCGSNMTKYGVEC